MLLESVAVGFFFVMEKETECDNEVRSQVELFLLL